MRPRTLISFCTALFVGLLALGPDHSDAAQTVKSLQVAPDKFGAQVATSRFTPSRSSEKTKIQFVGDNTQLANVDLQNMLQKTQVQKKQTHRPGQLRSTVGKRPLPELVFMGGVYLGGKLVTAGGTITLSKERAIKVKNGKCVFNTHYKIKNAGPVATPSKFRNRIRVDGAVNSTVPDPAFSPGATLNAGITMTMVHNTKLKPGMHSVVVSIDDDTNVLESNETNNKLSFRVRVKGSCKSGRGQRPDLVPSLTHPMSGKIVVKNIGNAPAGKTKLTLSCDKLPGNGRCPEPATTDYDDPAFPNHVVVRVPALAPGSSYVHNLSFWPLLHWSPGRYKFVATADATGAETERNETNNAVSSFLKAK